VVLHTNGGQMTPFQIIDDKRDCFGVYTNGNFIYDVSDLPFDGGVTWSWSSHLSGRSHYYGYILSGGKTISEACPEHLKERLTLRQRKIKSFINSFIQAKIKIDDACLFDLIPSQHLKHYLEVKNQICHEVFTNSKAPKNYSLLHDIYEMINDISLHPLRLDWELLERLALKDMKAKSLLSRFKGSRPTIKYDLYGTVTGRLSIQEGSFPILNVKTENRGILTPCNDAFLELDYNAEQIRTLLSLSKKEQPNEDIHEWNRKNVYRGFGTRDKAKKRFFAWLYDDNSDDHLTERFYDRDSVLERHYHQGVISTPFGREIECDKFHALNYLIQSTASDNCLSQVSKIHRFLKNKKTRIAFVIHDSVVIDLAKDETYLIPQIKEIFEDTSLGKFPVNMKLGKNYGYLKEFSW
tara:strand:- start:4078 stop:5304 length:1227 start_codon:yes stop_codon:yes gene_type:complete